MNGGSSAQYLTCTPCVPLFCTLFNKGGSRRAFRLPGAGGGSFPLYGGTFARSYSVSEHALAVCWMHWKSGTDNLFRAHVAWAIWAEFMQCFPDNHAPRSLRGVKVHSLKYGGRGSKNTMKQVVSEDPHPQNSGDGAFNPFTEGVWAVPGCHGWGTCMQECRKTFCSALVKAPDKPLHLAISIS